MQKDLLTTESTNSKYFIILLVFLKTFFFWRPTQLSNRKGARRFICEYPVYISRYWP